MNPNQNQDPKQIPGNTAPCCQAMPLSGEVIERMKREGWPSIEEQLAYWKRKEREESINITEAMAMVMDALAQYFADIEQAGTKLRNVLEAAKLR